MGKKKSEEAGTATESRNDGVSAAPSDIFRTLFGNVDEDATASSVFSDSNPFKRKPQEPGPGVDFVEEMNKRKRAQEERTVIDRVVKTSNESGLESRRKKKRKRDDVEMEYEERKYGASVTEDVAAVDVGKKRKKADNPEDLLVSKEGEGFDDENKLLRTIFVGNLPLKVKKKALVKEFSQFGEVESVRIRSVPIVDTKVPRKGAILLKKINDSADSVHAYIVFKTEESAADSLAHNMAEFAGNHIRVDRACPPRKKLKGEDASLYDNKRTVFVGNLPFDVKDEEVYQLFSGIKDLGSSIEAVRVVRDQNAGLGKGIAYVLFKTMEAAKMVVKRRNLKIRDRELRLSHARQDSTPSKRKNPFGAETAKTPTKRKAADSRTPGSNGGSITKSDMSYQGLRANKSGMKRKVKNISPVHNGVVKSNSKNPKSERRQGKRPAVAKRKEKAKLHKDGGASAQAGKKRKLDSRSPRSSNMKKKAKKFR